MDLVTHRVLLIPSVYWERPLSLGFTQSQNRRQLNILTQMIDGTCDTNLNRRNSPYPLKGMCIAYNFRKDILLSFSFKLWSVNSPT